MNDFILPEHHCPICGKEFYPTAVWVYKYDGKIFCSWPCFQRRFEICPKPITKHYHVKPVLQYSLAGKLIGEFSCAEEAARLINTSRQYVQKVCRSGKQAKGYYWRYKENELSEMQK